MSKKSLTCVDLFSGAGGLSRGFMDAGFDVVLGVDFDDAALKTFKNNHGSAEAMKLDLFNLNNVNKIKDYIDSKDLTVDVLVGGPPCQGFSLAGKREEYDKRNSLYLAMVKTAEILKPRAIVLENVPGMLTLYNGKAKERIFSDFEALGYNMNVEVLYAPDFGVPQIRKRAFFVGLLNQNEKFSYPVPTFDESNYVTTEQAIGDLPSLEEDYDLSVNKVREYSQEPYTDYQRQMRKNMKLLYNHIPTNHMQKTIDALKLVPDGGKYTDLPSEMSQNFKYHESLHRYNSKTPSLTIDTGHRTHFHYKWNRIPTVRENARLQSFPDDFIFYGNKQEQYKQVGNAVPVLLGKAVAEKLKEYLQPYKYTFIDLFAGCGGLLDGFMQSGYFNHIASVEWEKSPINTLKNRLKNKWGADDNSSIRFDMQRTDELINGFIDDSDYGSSDGLAAIVGDRNVDLIIGGPPCQAYSVAGRISDKNGMKDDYRNYLFEYYMKVVERFQPKLFVFENVPGILSAMPDGTPIINLIKRDMNKCGYEVIDDLKKNALLNAADFGVPQNRKRVIIIGINKKLFDEPQRVLTDFYKSIIKKYEAPQKSVIDAIGDMPKLIPLDEPVVINGKRRSHSIPDTELTWHYSRFINKRDIKIYRMLAKDLASGENKYLNADYLCELYNSATGANTKVHKYHVLRPNEPSTTILAHLYKDGLRFIHYDPDQARSITVREAARLQSFDDDFDFIGSQGDAYKMIGNAVPPLFAKAIACAINEFIVKNEK